MLAVGFTIVVVVAARELARERESRRRRGLLALRVVTALGALALATQPGWRVEQIEQIEGRLSVLLDGSRSMTIAEGGGAPRSDRARAVVERWASGSGRDRASSFSFGASVRPLTLAAAAEEYPALDDATGLADAIEHLLSGADGGDLGAVVVVSDGADPRALDRVAAIARRGVKVHAVSAATDGPIRDDGIAEVAADPVAFLRQPARVRVRLRSMGGEARLLPVSLRLGESVVREALVELDERGEGEVELPFTPDRLGRAVYRLSIPLAPEDAVPENNERAFLVRVTRDKLRVLLVAGRPTWDVRFLRAFLKRDPALDLISFFILRSASDLTMASPDELALIPFPTDELFREHLGSFDVVFFQDFDFGPYQMGVYLPRIRDYVLRGGSFAMIGGELSFASGGYGGTPIEAILPVLMPPGEASSARTLATDRFRPELATEMVRHPLLELLPDPAANAAAWARLSPLTGSNVLEGLRGDGQALLVHPTRRTPTGGPMPILSVGTAGRGRVLALGVDTSWRWGMSTGGLSGDSSAYERFWDRVLRWLARDPALEPVAVTTDRERYGPGARIRVTALLRDVRYEPITDREVELAIVDADGEARTAARTRTDGDGRAELELVGPDRSGGYRVTVRLSDEAEPRGEEGFVIETGGDELADPRPRASVLRALADATGGVFVAEAEDAPDLAAFDATRSRSLGVVEVRPFATAWAFGLVLLALGAEWLLRRRWGYR